MDNNQVRKLRIRVIIYGFLVFVFIIILRLFYLQIDQKNRFIHLGEKNFIRIEVIPPLRGTLYDCNKVLLAANRPVFDLCWQGKGAPALHSSHLALLEKLENLTNGDFRSDDKLRALKMAEKYSRRLVLKADLGFEQLCKISEQCSDMSSLIIENRFERIYPYKNFASHLLGYLSRMEKIGCAGVEKLFQQELQGKTGYIKSIFNSTGKKLHEKEFKDAQAGVDIDLTLDFNLQRLGESLFAPDQSGVVIVMDPETGGLKTLVSYPSFDPNLFLMPLSQEEWVDKFTLNNPLLNRITCAMYPPASIFKIVTMAAGLEEGIITPYSEFCCRGFLKFCGRKYFCQRRWGHGKLRPDEALAFSCNIPCFEIAKRLHINTLASYAFKFGLGNKTNFLLPEKIGLIPTSTWKVAKKGEPWWSGETLSASIGQSYLQVTPLQVARLFSSVFTGYLVKPRILMNEEIERESLMLSPKTLEILREGMFGSMQYGTLYTLKKHHDFEIYGKTGTAQTRGLEKEKTLRQHYEHAWLALRFRYKNEKPLTLVTLVEHAGSSRPAVLLADKFLTEYKNVREAEMAMLK